MASHRTMRDRSVPVTPVPDVRRGGRVERAAGIPVRAVQLWMISGGFLAMLAAGAGLTLLALEVRTAGAVLLPASILFAWAVIYGLGVLVRRRASSEVAAGYTTTRWEFFVSPQVAAGTDVVIRAAGESPLLGREYWYRVLLARRASQSGAEAAVALAALASIPASRAGAHPWTWRFRSELVPILLSVPTTLWGLAMAPAALGWVEFPQALIWGIGLATVSTSTCLLVAFSGRGVRAQAKR